MLNPFLYSLCSQRFRQESWKILHKVLKFFHLCKTTNTNSAVESAPILQIGEEADGMVVEYHPQNGQKPDDEGVISILAKKTQFSSLHIWNDKNID